VGRLQIKVPFLYIFKSPVQVIERGFFVVGELVLILPNLLAQQERNQTNKTKYPLVGAWVRVTIEKAESSEWLCFFSFT